MKSRYPHPFRKCRDCKSRGICRQTRRILRRYFMISDFPKTGQAWPWDHGLCPDCVLTFPFKAQDDCLSCGGSGWVAEKRARGTAAEGNQDWMDVGLHLHRLPMRQRQAIEAWIFMGELQERSQQEILRKIRSRPALFRKRLCAGLQTLARAFKTRGLL